MTPRGASAADEHAEPAQHQAAPAEHVSAEHDTAATPAVDKEEEAVVDTSKPSVAPKVRADEKDSRTEAASNEQADVVLVLDASASMLLTDPQRLRDEGAKLAVQFLKPGDRLAIVQFAERAQVIRPLTEFSRDQGAEIERQISSVPTTGEYTDILAGVEAAQRVLGDSSREDANRVVILLSDGKMDPDPNVGAREARTNQLVNEVLPELRARAIKAYTVAFSDQADKDLLAQIANATEGSHWYASGPERIHESYADLFLAVKKPQVLPLTSKGFRVDPDIQEATFYINRENAPEITIEAPNGERLTSENHPEEIKWFHGQRFEVITLLKPQVGTWQVIGLPSTDGFATVLTNVKLATDWPAALNAGDTEVLKARLYESDKPIVLPEMTGVIQYAFQVTPTDRVSEPILREFLKDEGTDGDERANDGVFSAQLNIEEEGEYRLRVVARGPTFERQQYLPFRVRPRLVSLSVVTLEANRLPGEGRDEGAEGPGEATSRDFFRVQLSEEASSLKDMEVKLIAVSDKRRRFSLPLIRSLDNALRFDAAASALPQEGEYEVYASLRGESKKKGRRVQAASQVLKYSKSSKHELTKDEVQEIEIKEEKKEKPSSIPYFLLVLVANAGVGGWLFTKFSKQKGGDGVPSIPKLASLEEIHRSIEKLREQAAVTAMDLADARLTDLSIVAAPALGTTPAEGAEAAAAPETAPPAAGSEEVPTAAAGETAPAGEATSEPPPEGEGQATSEERGSADADANEAEAAEEPPKEG